MTLPLTSFELTFAVQRRHIAGMSERGGLVLQDPDRR